MAKFQAKGVQVQGLRKVIREVEKLGVEVQDLKSVFTRIGARALATANAGTPVRTTCFVFTFGVDRYLR